MTNSNLPKPLWERQNLRVNDALENDELELTEWETNFLKSLHRQQINKQTELSAKQLTCLEQIEHNIKYGRPQR